jgi:hypothetical protein
VTGKWWQSHAFFLCTQPSAVCHCRTLACLPAQYAVRAQTRGGKFRQCIFHESCRRHVRPLPASLSCTQTTIPFLLPSSLSNYHKAINMPTSLALSAIAGWVSVSSWVVVYSPQIIENFQLQSGEGLSVAFIARQPQLPVDSTPSGPASHLTDLNRPFADPSYSSPSGTPFATSSSSSKCITTAVWPPRPAPRRLPS